MLIVVYLEYDFCFQRQAKVLELTMQRLMLMEKSMLLLVLRAAHHCLQLGSSG